MYFTLLYLLQYFLYLSNLPLFNQHQLKFLVCVNLLENSPDSVSVDDINTSFFHKPAHISVSVSFSLLASIITGDNTPDIFLNVMFFVLFQPQPHSKNLRLSRQQSSLTKV